MAAANKMKLAKDQALAGLSYAFEAVSVAPPTRRSPQKAHRAPPAAAAASAPAKVAFCLRERGPGPAYSSRPPAAVQPRQPQDEPTSRPGSAERGAASIAALKLASLRRRAAVLASAPAADEPEGAAAAQPAHSVAAAAEEAGRQQQEEEDALLRCVEARLAGCGSGALQEPAAVVLPPQHVLLGLPALARGPPAAAPAANNCGGQQQEALIGAYRPADSSGAAAEPPGARLEANGCPDGCPAEADSSSVTAATSPQTLEEALQCLGLLDQQPAEALSSAGSSSSDGVAGQPRWVRLRAVQVVVAAKQRAASAADLLPLVQRLRQVHMHLEFHKVGRPAFEGLCCYTTPHFGVIVQAATAADMNKPSQRHSHAWHASHAAHPSYQ